MPSPHDYVELRTRSAFSFLEACSNPEDLIETAAERGHETLALADRDGVSGTPRFHKAARQAGIRALVGSVVSVAAPLEPDPLATPDRVTLLCESPEGWRRLCRVLTEAHARRDKTLESRDPRARGLTRVDWDVLEAEAGHWSVLLRGDERLTPTLLERAAHTFGDRLAVDVSHLLDPRIERAGRRAAGLRRVGVYPISGKGLLHYAEAALP